MLVFGGWAVIVWLWYFMPMLLLLSGCYFLPGYLLFFLFSSSYNLKWRVFKYWLWYAIWKLVDRLAAIRMESMMEVDRFRLKFQLSGSNYKIL